MIPSRELRALNEEIEKGETRMGEVRRHIEMLKEMNVETVPAERTLKALTDAQAERLAKKAALENSN